MPEPALEAQCTGPGDVPGHCPDAENTGCKPRPARRDSLRIGRGFLHRSGRESLDEGYRRHAQTAVEVAALASQPGPVGRDRLAGPARPGHRRHSGKVLGLPVTSA